MIIAILFGSANDPLVSANEDNEVKNDVSKVAAHIQVFQVNNKGTLPTEQYIESGDFASQYMKGDSAASYKYEVDGDDAEGKMNIHLSIKCDGTRSSSRAFSISTKLSTGKRYCLDS